MRIEDIFPTLLFPPVTSPLLRKMCYPSKNVSQNSTVLIYLTDRTRFVKEYNNTIVVWNHTCLY